MAVIDFKEKWSARTVRKVRHQYEATRGWTVLMDSPSDDPLLIVEHNDYPALGTAYSGTGVGQYLFVTDVSMPRPLGPTFYEITATYTTVNPGTVPDFPDSPLDELPVYEWSEVRNSYEMDTDLDGERLFNAADCPMRGCYKETSDTILRVTRNEGSFSIAAVEALRNRVNSTPFMGADANTLKLNSIVARNVYNKGLYYYVITYEFQHRAPSGGEALGQFTDWNFRPLDAGTYELFTDKDGKKKQRAIEVNGRQVDYAWPLKPNGEKDEPGAPARRLNFRVYDAIDFNTVFNF